MKWSRLLTSITFTLFVGYSGFCQQEISVQAVVERTDVYVGDAFQFQIHISGVDRVEEPDLFQLSAFRITALGGRSSSTTRITTVNGRITQVVEKQYVLPYELTPLKSGTFLIPPLSLEIDGKTYTTRSIQIKVNEPGETEEFKIRLKLSKNRCYIGEPITLSVFWYIGLDVSNFVFNLPIFETPDAATVFDPETEQDPRKEYIRMPIETVFGLQYVDAEKGRGEYAGKQYPLLVSFQKIIIPHTPGTYKIPKAIASIEASIGSRQSDLFDQFFGQNRSYNRFVVPSNNLELTVAELPAGGQPDSFNGHIGKYAIDVTAAPLDVNVGDPITLTITLSGGSYMKNVRPPLFDHQPLLLKDFKVPSEMSPGSVIGTTKVFTQTIRALHDQVSTIPAIELPHFNPDADIYEVARSDPIPIIVHPTRVVTFQDIEGTDSESINGQELQSWAEGIAFNYDDLSVLEHQDYGLATLFTNPLWASAMGAPVFIFLLLASFVWRFRSDRTDPKVKKMRLAYNEFLEALQARSGANEHLENPSHYLGLIYPALQKYLGQKLSLPTTTVTYKDVEFALRELGIGEAGLACLKEMFSVCEAFRFAGEVINEQDIIHFSEDLLKVVKEIEEKLRGT